ncbi:MAG: hypothetical protein JWM47_3047, partial [Acidimicrobiales bacterium]|nr:hypothetical protein [Acidimicrobiales bacterium]
RRDHVEAVAADLDRVTASPGQAAEPLARAARVALADRLGVAADASPAVLHAAAERAGVQPGEIDLLGTPQLDLTAALAVGELAARRQQLVHHRPNPAEPPGATP